MSKVLIPNYPPKKQGPPGLEIKPLREVPHLRARVASAHLAVWNSPTGTLDPSTWGFLGDENFSQIAPWPLTLVATVNGEYAGAGSIIPRDMDHQRYREVGPWFGGLLVLERFRGLGIGTQLHFQRLALAALHGIDKVHLFTELKPYPTVTMYARLGWELTEVVRDFNDGTTTEDRFVMTVCPGSLFTSIG